jgi:hypothetical protein
MIHDSLLHMKHEMVPNNIRNTHQHQLQTNAPRATNTNHKAQSTHEPAPARCYRAYWVLKKPLAAPAAVGVWTPCAVYARCGARAVVRVPCGTMLRVVVVGGSPAKLRPAWPLASEPLVDERSGLPP